MVPYIYLMTYWASLLAQTVKASACDVGDQVQSLGQGPQPPRTPVITAVRRRPGSCPFSGVMVGSKMASASRFV